MTTQQAIHIMNQLIAASEAKLAAAIERGDDAEIADLERSLIGPRAERACLEEELY